MKPFTFSEAWLHVFGDKSPEQVVLKFALHIGHADLRTWIKAEIADSLEDVIEHERHDVCRELYKHLPQMHDDIDNAIRKGFGLE